MKSPIPRSVAEDLFPSHLSALGVLATLASTGRPLSIEDLTELASDPQSVTRAALVELKSAGYVRELRKGGETVYVPDMREE